MNDWRFYIFDNIFGSYGYSYRYRATTILHMKNCFSDEQQTEKRNLFVAANIILS